MEPSEIILVTHQVFKVDRPINSGEYVYQQMGFDRLLAEGKFEQTT